MRKIARDLSKFSPTQKPGPSWPRQVALMPIDKFVDWLAGAYGLANRSRSVLSIGYRGKICGSPGGGGRAGGPSPSA